MRIRLTIVSSIYGGTTGGGGNGGDRSLSGMSDAAAVGGSSGMCPICMDDTVITSTTHSSTIKERNDIEIERHGVRQGRDTFIPYMRLVVANLKRSH